MPKTNFPVLHDRRIKNSDDLKAALGAAMADTLAGKITPKEARAINREAGKIVKLFWATVSAQKTAQGAARN